MVIDLKRTIFDVLYTKQAFLDYENIGLKKPHNWHFFIFSTVLIKKLNFFHLLCLSKGDREKVFADDLDRKEAFQDFLDNSS